MYGYIYITTNLINGKKYIGRHKAEKFDNYYKGSGYILKEAIKKYGRENFSCEVLEWCETKEIAFQREDYWVKYFNAVEDPNFYNLTEGGCGPLEVPEDVKERLRKAFTGESNPAKRPEVRKKISEGKLGAKNPMYGHGHPQSEETKEKLRQINLGRKMPDWAKENISKAKKGKPSPKRKKIIINGIEYESITQAMKELKINTRRLYKILKEQSALER